MIESTKKHIVIITHSYPRFDGDWHAHFIEMLAIAYAKKAKVTVLVPYTLSWKRSAEENGVRLIAYKYLPWMSGHKIGEGEIMEKDLKVNKALIFTLPFLLLMGIWRLRCLLKEEHIDVIQAHWAIPNSIIAVVGRLLSRKKVKVFTSFPGSDVTVLRSLGLVGKLLASLIGQSDFLSCNSQDLKDELVDMGIASAKIDLVIYGVDHRRICFDADQRNTIRAQYQIPEECCVLLLMGRFVPKKGFSLAIEALPLILAKTRNIKLLIVGSGPLRTEYDLIIEKYGLHEYIIFVGSIPTDMLISYYSACDILLNPAQRLPADGLNVVVPEAMSCARPIIASEVGGNDLVVFPGQNGYLHPERDQLSLAKYVWELAQNRQLRDKMGRQSRELVDERFNWDAIADYYLSKV